MGPPIVNEERPMLWNFGMTFNSTDLTSVCTLYAIVLTEKENTTHKNNNNEKTNNKQTNMNYNFNSRIRVSMIVKSVNAKRLYL